MWIDSSIQRLHVWKQTRIDSLRNSLGLLPPHRRSQWCFSRRGETSVARPFNPKDFNKVCHLLLRLS